MANFRISWGDVKNVRNMITPELLKERKHPARLRSLLYTKTAAAARPAGEERRERALRKEREGETKEDWRQVSYRDPPAGQAAWRKNIASEREAYLQLLCS
jgi:hypothetical protein